MYKRIFLVAAVALLALAGCRPAERAFVTEKDGAVVFENNLIAGRFSASSPGLDVLAKMPSGETKDFYDEGATLGGGASAPFINGRICYPANGYSDCSIERHGPDTVAFTLTYPEWEADEGIRVALKKTVTVAADSHFCDVEDVYTFSGAPALIIATGFNRHQGKGTIEIEHNFKDRLAIWEAPSDPAADAGEGRFGVAVVMPEAQMIIYPNDRSHSLLLQAVGSGDSIGYKIGSCWSEGDLKTAQEWFKLVDGQ